MSRRNSIEKLDPRIREAVDRLVRDGRATIDDIVEHIDSLGGEASRSAVGRYVKGAREQMERYRQAQEVAKVWVGKLEEDRHGDVGRLLSEMLRTVAFTTISTMADSGEELPATPGEIMFLAKAIKELAAADKTTAERELRIRRDAAATADKIARKDGLSRETAERIKAAILGVQGAPA